MNGKDLKIVAEELTRLMAVLMDCNKRDTTDLINQLSTMMKETSTESVTVAITGGTLLIINPTTGTLLQFTLTNLKP